MAPTSIKVPYKNPAVGFDKLKNVFPYSGCVLSVNLVQRMAFVFFAFYMQNGFGASISGAKFLGKR